MKTQIALVGNPNSGKTTLFNSLTGAKQYVGNWPGVTVEKKQGALKGEKETLIVDLPGIYALSCDSPEEKITLQYLKEDAPDVVINIVDATNLERNLFLSLQVMELGIPMVIALNMTDLLDAQGTTIQVPQLEALLGCKIVEISALKGKNLQALLSAAKAAKKVPTPLGLGSAVESALEKIGLALEKEQVKTSRFQQLSLLEKMEDASLDKLLSASHREKVSAVIASVEASYGDDGRAMVIEGRYAVIDKIAGKAVTKKNKADTFTEKVDKVVLNRFLALPIFALVMFGIYYVSVTWLGAIVTDWTNDTLFGTMIQPAVTQWLTGINAADWLIGLIVDGCIGGVGAVLGFVPQMLILFFLLALLEDFGYMSRVAFMMDRLFKKFGLSGKSFIPMLIASGCGVPGIMASRTIESEGARRMTVMTSTFIPCGAKLPVIALIGGAMFPDIIWFAPAIYFIGVGAVLFSGIFLKKTGLFKGDDVSFIMELPAYRVPALRGVIYRSLERGKSFIIKAGTVIFVACGLIWFLSSFGVVNGSFGMVEANQSLLAVAGTALVPLFAPLGFGQWESVVATVTGLVAKENVVGTFSVLLGLGGGEEAAGLLPAISVLFPYGAAAFSFLVFNMLCAPCFAAIGAMRKEMASFRWTVFAIGYQTALAYGVAFCVNQIGGFFTGAVAFGIGPILGILFILIVAIFLALPQGTFSFSKKVSVANAERSL